MKVDEQISESRLAYELILGRISDHHWYRVRQILRRHNLEVTVKNVQLFAEVRKVIPRSAIGVDGILTCYEKVELMLGKSDRHFKGYEVIQTLQGYGVRPHQTTISRWFKPLGGYRKEGQYKPEKLRTVFIQALIYKAHHSVGLPEAN
jgi:hypothetical protein